MILGAISLISLFLIVIITCAKIWNVVNGGKLYPEIFKYFGFAGVFFAWMFLLISVNVNINAASNDVSYNPDLFEASQYLSFANNFLMANIFLIMFEVILGWKMFNPRSRLKKSKDGAAS